MTNAFWIGISAIDLRPQQCAIQGLEFLLRMTQGDTFSTVRDSEYLECIRADGVVVGYGVIVESGFEEIEFTDDVTLQENIERIKQEFIRHGIAGEVSRNIQPIDEPTIQILTIH